ncbi:hypothetical protein AMELA_G00122250 [Ameiurus melas]|uniref:Uncharacterized protein n=1 Tax=Ameiurus melas TaxID=219545 RepID=A0A7J6ALT9_AMEME|nr:hypothetical protein AMELA_G00122250 [Ameiurus melas]
MLSDSSSAPTLLGCRPSGRHNLGRSQNRFQLLTNTRFCLLHKETNQSLKARSLLNFSAPRLNVGRGPETMIFAVGDLPCTVSIRLEKSLFRTSDCCSLVSFVPACSTTAPMRSSFIRIPDTCAATSRTRAPEKQCVCTLPLNEGTQFRTMESPTITALGLV